MMAKPTRLVFVEPPGQKGYLPLASGYLAASLPISGVELERDVDLRFVFEHFSHPFHDVFQSIVDHEPDIVAFSCQGWAVKRADELGAQLRERFPDLLIVYGGNHVSNSLDQFFVERPFADILVHGEGEITFSEIVRAYRKELSDAALEAIPGISFRNASGAITRTGARDRIADLDIIPSPYLEGVLDIDCERYSTVLLETNRGCPYRCSFCYWGGATQAKVRKFGMDRLKAEMELLAQASIDTWIICDANFGILPRDEEIVDLIVAVRNKYGYPKTISIAWAKHSNEKVLKICARLNKAGIYCSYSIALQTTDPHTLEVANRKNMSVNRVDELSELCRQYGVLPKGELIWGLPGETYEKFLNSYDVLANCTDSCSVYPLYILPNTEYHARAEELKIRTVNADVEFVYEYCIEHYAMSEQDFLEGLRFIISNNILRVAGVFLYVYPRIAGTVAGIRYAHIVEGFKDYVLSGASPALDRFKKFYRFPLASHRQSLAEAWNALLHDADAFTEALQDYVRTTFNARQPQEIRTILDQALRFDMAIYPRVDSREEEEATPDGFYWSTEQFDYDFLSAFRGETFCPERKPRTYQFKLLAGLWRYPYDNLYFGLLSFRGEVSALGQDEDTTEHRAVVEASY